MEKKKCNIEDLKLISGLIKLFVMSYVGLDELNIYKEEDGYKKTLIVEDAKEERRILTYNSYKNDENKVDGEYFFPVDGKQKPYQITKINYNTLLLLRGKEFDINQMCYLKGIDLDEFGICGKHELGFNIIGSVYQRICATDIVDINILTKQEQQKGLTLTKGKRK